ncbi:hypothetical protein M422DRAFT_23651 [Sphaerobolus stellatus SS14]|nr:hypothetical protein M422DRAFT_23651 [Sphaerobolus stellatus SS14]
MVLRLAVLLCDTPNPAVFSEHGDYLAIFKRFFQASLPDPTVKYTVDGYDVVNKQEYPSLDDNYDGVLLTGSAASAYADLPWIHKLIEFVRTLATERPEVKIIGICFGHQIIAEALGSKCVHNGKWEIGTTEIKLTDKGKEIFGVPSINIQEMHRDEVPTLPPGFVSLGSTDVSQIQGMILPYKENPSQIQIFSVQGHPEFLPDIVNKIVDAREESGVMDPSTVKYGRENAVKPDDGTSAIGRAIWKVIGVEAP